MKQWLAKLLSSSPEVSSTRVAMFYNLFVATIVTFYGMTKVPIEYYGLATLVGVFISAAVGGKAFEAFAAAKKPTETDNK